MYAALLGASVASRPEYDGASTRQTKLRPLWAFQWGRWRISTSGGSAILGFGRDAGQRALAIAQAGLQRPVVVEVFAERALVAIDEARSQENFDGAGAIDGSDFQPAESFAAPPAIGPWPPCPPPPAC